MYTNAYIIYIEMLLNNIIFKDVRAYYMLNL